MALIGNADKLFLLEKAKKWGTYPAFLKSAEHAAPRYRQNLCQRKQVHDNDETKISLHAGVCRKRSESDGRFAVDFVAMYEEILSTAVSENPAVAVPLLTINSWIVMQRKVTGGSVSFNQNWAEYRGGFGAASGNDNYWLGLEKVYRLMQLGTTSLRVEVNDNYWLGLEKVHGLIQLGTTSLRVEVNESSNFRNRY